MNFVLYFLETKNNFGPKQFEIRSTWNSIIDVGRFRFIFIFDRSSSLNLQIVCIENNCAKQILTKFVYFCSNQRHFCAREAEKNAAVALIVVQFQQSTWSQNWNI